MPMGSFSRTEIAGGQTWLNDRLPGLVPAPRYINRVDSRDGAAHRQAVPAGAFAVRFSADGDFYALAGGADVAAPSAATGDIEDGTAAALNPVDWVLPQDVTHISLRATTDTARGARSVTLWFYLV